MSKKFKRQDYFRYKKLGAKWRRPKGRQSKMRKAKAGNHKTPSVGFRGPMAGRYKISGKIPVVVRGLPDIGKLDGEKIAIISSGIGMKKMLQVSEELEKRKIAIANPKRVKKAIRLKKNSEKKSSSVHGNSKKSNESESK
ncbi:MAG: 50S ribosomal protein L32e [Candidatus Aenigmarchaeota archaeon]|nr:50S ribosomal protein L32e [Candidatus Aenigmarchaeota archaeon]